MSRCAISELCFGEFPDPDDFQRWRRVNFETEVCVGTPFFHLTVSWINEVEIAKSIDDLTTSRSIAGKSFPDFEMLDARIASALRRIIFNTSFRRRVSVEEQRAQKDNMFLRGRQLAYMIYGHFQSTAACDAAQGLSDLFNTCLQNDDVQDFDTRCDQI